MKTRVLIMLMSFLFAFNSNYAVNNVSIAKNANESKVETHKTLELKKIEKKATKVGEKVKSLKLISKIKKVLDDANTILLVILSLFPILCLIAVYLKDGGITLNFWVDLLLHLTVIGAMIFAILVVLDIVNLA